MKLKRATCVFVLAMLLIANVSFAESLIAAGALDASDGDRANKTAKPLENGVHGNLFSGIGSGLGHAGGNRFIAVPDRGPNAMPYNDCVDDTTSYINRFHTLRLRLTPNVGAGLPFVRSHSSHRSSIRSSSALDHVLV
jgi:hypothetical protein